MVGVGSNTLRLLTKDLIGSTGIQRPSGRENTSVQKTGGVVRGSGAAGDKWVFIDTMYTA